MNYQAWYNQLVAGGYQGSYDDFIALIQAGDVVTYEAGMVTAYGAAVEGGYTGTYADFCTQQAQYAENAAYVADTMQALEHKLDAVTPGTEALLEQIEQAAASAPAELTAVTSSIASLYNGTATYKAGDYCFYNDSLYRCKTAIDTPEPDFVAAHWENAKMADDMQASVGDLKSAYAAYTDTLSGKNLMTVTKSNSTTNGVVFTNNGDGTVTANGTSTAKIQIKFGDCYLHAGKNYILSGLEYASGALQVLDSANTTQYAQQQGGVETTFDVPSDGIYNIRFFLGTGKTINETIDPMVRGAYYLDGTFEPKTKAKSGIAVWIGDSFVQANSLASAGLDQTKRFSTLVSNYFNLTEKNYAVGGMGFITGETPYSTQLTNAVADHTYDHADVTHVFISGGINDLNTANKETLLSLAVKALVDSAYAEYKNAKIYVIPLMYYDKNITQDAYWTYKTIANACAEAKALLIPNAYTWLNGMLGDILDDGVHPNIEGHALIASHIQNALITGDSFAYPASCAYSALSSKIDTEADNYFCTIKRNSEITVNGVFTLTENATKYERLFEYTGAGKNNPTYIGRYGKHVLAVNMNTGATVVLLVTQEDVTENDSIVGYKNYCQAMMAIPAGTWKVVTATLNAGMQEYAGNKS